MSDDDIVVCGIGGRFPGADNVDQFWTLLTNGENHMKDIPPERCDIDKHYDPDPNKPRKSYVKKAALIKNIYEWDYNLYGISEREAQTMDPQQRLVLDSVYMAMEDAGITAREFDGSQTAVFIGAMNDDFKSTYYDHAKTVEGMAVTGLFPTLISARVSYVFNLLGTAATIDTACSSSLVAIHMACQALKCGECDAAIAGGVNFINSPLPYIVLSKARMLSPTGQCHTFSDEADGYARGEGCGIVILKKLKQALVDGNPIWGIIKTATNQDGRTVTPVNAPSQLQQFNLLKQIYSNNNVNRDRIQVIETHGTGTSIGDPTEIDALGEFFSEGGYNNRERPIAIGSVKTNIGHLESAAGVTGLIKSLLMMKHRTIVPSLMYSTETENPRLKLEKYKMKVAVGLTDWLPNTQSPRMACVNSFGFGGTNAHAIIQEFSKYDTHSVCSHNCSKQDAKHIVVLSATDEQGLIENMKSFQKGLQDVKPNLHAVSYTSACKRTHHNKRVAFVVNSHDELEQECNKLVKYPKQVQSKKANATEVVFFFCGVGTSWNGMAKELLEIDIFEMAVKRLDGHLMKLTGWSIIDAWTNGKDMKDPLLNHLSIFTYQVGLIALWDHWGIKPDVVVGQSVGEVAAAFCSGALELKLAVDIIYLRSKALLQCKEGKMLVIRNFPIETIQKICNDKGETLVISGYNSPTSCVVSGGKDEILELKGVLAQDNNVALYDIDSPCAYHSSYVEKAVDELEKTLQNKNISCSAAKLKMISTVSGKQCKSWDLESPTYWIENVRKPVQLHSAIKEAKSLNKNTLIIEIGPRPTLRAHIQDIFHDTDAVSVIPSILREKENDQLKTAVAIMYMNGLNPEWNNIIEPCSTNSPIPRYSFSRHLALYQMDKFLTEGEAKSHSYVSRVGSSYGQDVSYEVKLNEETAPFVFQHFVKEVVVVPGATYADVGFEIGKCSLGLQEHEIEVSLDFITPIRPGSNGEIELSVQTSQICDTVISFVVMQGSTIACKGMVDRKKERPKLQPPADNFQYHLLTEYSHTDIYNQLKQMGFDYGDCFKQITSVITDGDVCVSKMVLHSSVLESINKTHFHACVLDCALQLTAMMFRKDEVADRRQKEMKVMPIGFGKIHKTGRLSGHLTVHAERINRTVMSSMLKEHYNIQIYDDFGTLVADIENAAFFCNLTSRRTPDDLKYQLSWKPIVLPELPGHSKQENIIIINGTEHTVCGIMPQDDGIINIDVPKGIELSVECLRNHMNSAIEKNQLSTEDVAAIVYCCDSTTIDANMTLETYSKALNQCKMVGNLVEMLIDLPSKPAAFIVTERVYSCHQTSPLGSEVWGYLRNVLQEYIFLDLTMIDVAPSLGKSYDKLLKVIRSKLLFDDATPKELAIHDDHVKAAIMVQSRKKEILPTYCNNVCTGDADLVIKSTSTEMFSTIRSKSKELSTINSKKMEKIEVEFVCLHNPEVYPGTERDGAVIGSSNLENMQEGKQVLALEYIGIAKSTTSEKPVFLNCDGQNIQTSLKDENINDKWRTAVLYPAQCAHVITVPTECTVSIRKHPWYKPGLLTLGTMCYNLAKLVTVNKRVGVIYSDRDCDSASVFSLMMRRRTQNVEMIDCSNISVVSRNMIPDTVVVLTVIDGRTYQSVKCCKEIICMNGMIPAALRTRLCVVDKVLVTAVDETAIFHPSKIRTTLPSVIKLLAKLDQPKFKHNNNTGKKDLVHASSDGIRLKTEGMNYCLHGMKVPIPYMFRKGSVYIVTGGLTGLGWELVLQMADMGAGVIVTFGRRPCSMEMAKTITETERMYSCSICPLVVDVTDEVSVKAAFVETKKRFPEHDVRGVIHGAGVVKSKLFVNRTEENLAENMSPKVVGTINLHNATKHLPIDYFVMHSSINSVIGSHGQSAYGAANNFMNVFAQWRRDQGLPALAIDWGALSVGMAAKEVVRKELENKGHILMTTEELRDCFIHALLHNDNMAIYANLDKAVIARDFSQDEMVNFQYKMDFLREDGLLSNGSDLKNQDLHLDLNTYRVLDEAEKLDVLSKLVIAIARIVFGFSEDDFSLSTTYLELGLDSMSALVFSNVLFEKLNYRLMHQVLFVEGHTLMDTVELLYEFYKQTIADEREAKYDENEQSKKRSGKKEARRLSTGTDYSQAASSSIQHFRKVQPHVDSPEIADKINSDKSYIPALSHTDSNRKSDLSITYQKVNGDLDGHIVPNESCSTKL